MRKQIVAAWAAAWVVCWTASLAAADGSPRGVTRRNVEADWVPNEVIVVYRDGSPASTFDQVKSQIPSAKHWRRLRHARFAKGTQRRRHPLSGVRVIELAEGQDVLETAERLSRLPNVAYAHPNYIMRAAYVPNDPLYESEQYAPQIIRMEEAWDLTTGNPDVVVAIADSGLKMTHEEFPVEFHWSNAGDPVDGADNDGNGFVDDFQGWDFINHDNSPSSASGHGTHVAGIALARINNGVGIAGMANCTVMPLQVFDAADQGTWEAIANAIFYAVDNGADLLNYSGGGPGGQGIVATAVQYAYNNDMPIVAASGNHSSSVDFFPAAYPKSIAVSATGPNDIYYASSGRGDYLDVCAPGISVHSAWNASDTDYRNQTGTSMATPHVSGLVALMYSLNPELTVDQIRTLLHENAVDLGDPGFDVEFGYGRIDAAATLEAVVDTIRALGFEFPTPLPTVVPPTKEITIDVIVSSRAEVLDPASPRVHYRYGPGSFASELMTSLGDDLYEAVLPAPSCGDMPEFYFSAVTDSGEETETEPSDAPTTVFQMFVGERKTIVDDDFEDDLGWVSSFEGGGSTTGQWVREDPFGTGRQPEDDFSDDGTFCYVTGNCQGGGDGLCDVDGGPVILTSPTFIAPEIDSVISYARWFGSSNGGDVLMVEISNDGGDSWVPLEAVEEATHEWTEVSFDVADFVEPSAEMKVRFSVEDTAPISVTESAIDEFLVSGILCEDDTTPPSIVHDNGLSTSPFSGFIDPLAESSDGESLDIGLDSLVITFSEPVRNIGAAGGGVTRDAFTVSTTAFEAPEVDSIEMLTDRSMRLQLSHPIPAGAWTTVIAEVMDGAGNMIVSGGNQGPDVDEPDRIDIGFLPCDVDQSGIVQPVDLLRFRQMVLGSLIPAKGEVADYIDTDRNGALQPVDLLVFRQLFAGTGDATQSWGGASIGDRP